MGRLFTLIRQEFITIFAIRQKCAGEACVQMKSDSNCDENTARREPKGSPRPGTAAARALAEAAERRAAAEKAQQAAEIGGREGPDPARYGDWEVKGIASDF
jgi:hypothetical protein